MAGARIQLRRGTAAHWESENPTLHPGEPGYETDTRRLKIGDGKAPWRELPYSPLTALGDEASAELSKHIEDLTPHPAYDDGPSLVLLYENAKV